MRRPALSIGLAFGAGSNVTLRSFSVNASVSFSSYVPSASAITVAAFLARATSRACASVRIGREGVVPALASLPRGDT